MEFCFVNLIEPGDEVIIGVNGVFGGRMVDVAERCGARVIKVEAPWGQIIEPSQIAEALKTCKPKTRRHCSRRNLHRRINAGSRNLAPYS